MIERVQYITSKPSEQEIIVETQQFLDGGGRWVQLRAKWASKEELITIGIQLKKLCRDAGAIFLVNDNVEIAKELSADGVHLGKSDMSTAEARKILGDKAIIGRTANTLDDIIATSCEKVNYIGLGPFRYTSTKEKLSPILGLQGYKDIFTDLKEQNIAAPPIVAIGGIEMPDIAPLINYGAYGIAVAGAIAKSQNPTQTTAAFIKEIKKHTI